ncbi:hypothetical protein N7447_004618 [Penicillium robsamsonii]|uniref:uncharacterized protein n=1 Tax=Penicillium robsamsonii TaxID=1792511 RepID=UPI0025488461|nr:uncharacterized protein N7447_004618 [Penicillium robsamsonii]KAJ5827855.1 hypothetical protein N7447_004618 [Penicillium robsamsonii]
MVMDFTVIEDIEKGDCIGNSGGVVPGGDHGKKLITKTLFVRDCIALLGKRNEQTLHDGRGFSPLLLLPRRYTHRCGERQTR